MKTRTITQLAGKLRKKHARLRSWPKASRACRVLTADGRPNPGLAKRIAEQGYDPARLETRQRLGLPPVCLACGRKVKRHVPAWLIGAVANLRRLEKAAHASPGPNRVYLRGGKLA